MVQRFTRRRFGAAAIVTASAAVAGCLGGESDDLDTGDQAVNLIITLEDENGDPVSQGVRVVIEHADGGVRQTYQYGIEAGTVTGQNLSEPGEYTVTVESTEDGDDFDRAEETIELEAAADADEAEENAADLTMTLDGALSDPEREEMANEDGGNGEEGETNSTEDSDDGEDE